VVASIESLNPSIAVGVAPFPGDTTAKTRVVLTPFQALSVWAKSPHIQAANTFVDLPAGTDGVRTMYVRVYDAAQPAGSGAAIGRGRFGTPTGNASNVVSDTIVLDTVAPTVVVKRTPEPQRAGEPVTVGRLGIVRQWGLQRGQRRRRGVCDLGLRRRDEKLRARRLPHVSLARNVHGAVHASRQRWQCGDDVNPGDDHARNVGRDGYCDPDDESAADDAAANRCDAARCESRTGGTSKGTTATYPCGLGTRDTRSAGRPSPSAPTPDGCGAKHCGYRRPVEGDPGTSVAQRELSSPGRSTRPGGELELDSRSCRSSGEESAQVKGVPHRTGLKKPKG